MRSEKRKHAEVLQPDVLATDGINQIPCGPTGDDAECACGCSGYDERCQYWVECEDAGMEVDETHTCCKVQRTTHT